MGVTKVSVTVDTEMLREVRKLAGKQTNLSSLLNDALRLQVHRMRMLALLDEMDATDPIDANEREAGERLWAEIQSSSTPERSPRSRRKGAGSA